MSNSKDISADIGRLPLSISFNRGTDYENGAFRLRFELETEK